MEPLGITLNCQVHLSGWLYFVHFTGVQPSYLLLSYKNAVQHPGKNISLQSVLILVYVVQTWLLCRSAAIFILWMTELSQVAAHFGPYNTGHQLARLSLRPVSNALTKLPSAVDSKKMRKTLVQACKLTPTTETNLHQHELSLSSCSDNVIMHVRKLQFFHMHLHLSFMLFFLVWVGVF